jgi:hypothetical protein
MLYGKQVHGYDIRYNGFTPEYLEGMTSGLGFKTIGIIKEEYDFILTVNKIND